MVFQFTSLHLTLGGIERSNQDHWVLIWLFLFTFWSKAIRHGVAVCLRCHQSGDVTQRKHAPPTGHIRNQPNQSDDVTNSLFFNLNASVFYEISQSQTAEKYSLDFMILPLDQIVSVTFAQIPLFIFWFKHILFRHQQGKPYTKALKKCIYTIVCVCRYIKIERNTKGIYYVQHTYQHSLQLFVR